MISHVNIQPIEKEQIKFLNFPKEDVFQQRREKMIRFMELRRGLSLGNLEQQKVRIVFIDDKGLKRVETTIWAITDKAVILKQSTIIPRQRIVSIS